MSYPRPVNDSGLGVHLSPNGDYPLGRSDELIRNTVEDLRRQGFTWAKVVVTPPYNTDWQTRAVDALVKAGFEVIVRLFVHKPYPGNVMPSFYALVDSAVRYWVARGVHYFELRNEPNLRDAEWESDGAWDAFGYTTSRARHAARLFISDAKVILNAGGIPLTPALAPGGHDDDEQAWQAMCEWWRDNGEHNTLRQCAIATHNYTLNHPLNHPYDAVNQKEWPGANLWSGGQSNGFLKYRYQAKVFRDHLGFTIPVLSTEDGPLMGNRADGRYPGIDEARHREVVLQIVEYMATEAEDDYLCTAFWLYGSRIFEAHGSPPPWEKDAWVSPYGNSLPGRSGVELPIIATLKDRGFKPRRKGVQWSWDAVEQPPYPDWLINVIDKLPKHPTLRYPKRIKPVDSIVIHHTATDSGTTVEDIARYHVGADPTRNKDEWAGIGYSVVIDEQGKTYLTQPLDIMANHIYAHNDHTIGLSFIGNFTKHAPTKVQYEAGRRALAWLLRELNLKPENVAGHKDFTYQTTACPGNIPTEKWWRVMLTEYDEQDVRNAAWNLAGIPYNPDSAFVKEARIRGLGYPITPEFDRNGFRAQGYEEGILICKIGDWANMELVEWL